MKFIYRGKIMRPLFRGLYNKIIKRHNAGISFCGTTYCGE